MLNFESTIPFEDKTYDAMVSTAKDAYHKALEQFKMMQVCLRKKNDGLSSDEISDEEKAMMSLTVFL